jgi:hypothetical protein
MTDADLIRSIGLRYSVIARCMGVTEQTVKTWACLGIPVSRRQEVLDLREAVRQITEGATS